MLWWAISSYLKLVFFLQEPKPGIIEVAKVLFSTTDLHAYIVPKKTPISLEDFSVSFQSWLSKKSMHPPSERDRKQKNKFSFWNRINVVLYLPEFEKDRTQFRRARHIRTLWPKPKCVNASDTSEDLYLELDTGMLRVHKSSNGTVMVLPQEWARIATAILEVRFRDAKVKNYFNIYAMTHFQTLEDVAEQIEVIRSTGKAFIYSFDIGNRRAVQTANANTNYKGDLHWDSKEWSNIETAVVRHRLLVE